MKKPKDINVFVKIYPVSIFNLSKKYFLLETFITRINVSSTMEPLKELHETITLLPRGGYLLDTSAGYIQFGAPPETIKDTMLLPKGVPTIFVLPQEFFNWLKGISVAELEFPIYYNFFIKKRKTKIICDSEQAHKFKDVIQESLFGPNQPDLSKDFAGAYSPDFHKNISRELQYFRFMNLDNVVEFCIYTNKEYLIDGILIRLDDYNNFDVMEEDHLIAHIPGKIEYKPRYLIGERLIEPFIPPLFGITCLGPSSGFDPYDNTSGFIIWLNHHGIMIDPPVNATEWLLDSNVSPKYIDSIILTHCHADHDAGTFQKILEERKVTIYTTETIMLSFVRKYALLTDVSMEYLMSLFNFHPIIIGKPRFIHGARFDFFYSLHSIPTMGFKVTFQNKSLAYSSDHHNDPHFHKKMLSEGIITEERYNDLANFPWDATIIFHETGVPPLHTPLEILASLPQEIQKKTVIYHTPKDSLPKKSSLSIAKFGIENTMNFDVTPPHFVNTYKILSLIRHIDFTNFLTIEKVQEFVSIAEEETFKSGETIIRKGSPGDKFYIIYSGNVLIKSEDGKLSKVYGAYDYFGEMALLKDEQRTADVTAETDVVVYSIDKEKFFSFIQNTEYDKILHRLVKVRDNQMWEIITASNFLKCFTATQREWLESLLFPIEVDKPGTLIQEGEKQTRLYIIRKGDVMVTENGEGVAILQQGDIIGLVKNMFENKPSRYTFTNSARLSLFAIEIEDLLVFLQKNPGLIMKLDYVFRQYLFKAS